ncbi:hypothetical protein WJX84_007725, partial [Apatococcus fuscideae]
MATLPETRELQVQDAPNLCWVCYDGPRPSSPLIQPCACPRTVHAECCARWQLHAAGKSEEHFCRFCQQQLPDWQRILTPHEAQLPAQCLPTMSVTFNDQQHHIVAQSGPGGYAAFEAEVRSIFGIEHDMDMNLIFDCAEPTTGSLLKLNGPGAFNAAVHCAKVSAAKRLRRCQAGQLQRGGHSCDDIPEAELEELALSDEQELPICDPSAEPSAPSITSVQPQTISLPKAVSEPSEEQLAAAFHRMSSSSSASGSASASGSGSSAQASPQPHVAGSSHPGHGPRFYRRYRSGRRVVTSHSASEGQHEATPAGPAGSAPELRRTRQRSSTMSELLEALCRVLASQRRPRSPLAGGAHRAGVTYHPRVPMDHMYYNSSFHPQQLHPALAKIDPYTSFLYTPHTISCLAIGALILVHQSRVFAPPDAPISPVLAADTSYANIKHGLWAASGVFLGYSVLQGPTTGMVRPHPAVWRLVHGVMVLYLLSLIFMLFQDVGDARLLLKHLYPKLGQELPERSYGSDCRLWIPGQGVHWQVIYDTVFDEFVIAHTLGWWGKALIIRDYNMLWTLSIGFELME